MTCYLPLKCGAVEVRDGGGAKRLLSCSFFFHQVVLTGDMLRYKTDSMSREYTHIRVHIYILILPGLT